MKSNVPALSFFLSVVHALPQAFVNTAPGPVLENVTAVFESLSAGPVPEPSANFTSIFLSGAIPTATAQGNITVTSYYQATATASGVVCYVPTATWLPFPVPTNEPFANHTDYNITESYTPSSFYNVTETYASSSLYNVSETYTASSFYDVTYTSYVVNATTYYPTVTSTIASGVATAFPSCVTVLPVENASSFTFYPSVTFTEVPLPNITSTSYYDVTETALPTAGFSYNVTETASEWTPAAPSDA
ncbi:hypothetical protein BT69DRAFT_1333203 [Atractiella rhizophila]|nr:hypothetical protein BT69DRAFT_1333203 [Atractiella rhizophila]